jgi:hypothetical protein
MYYKKNIPGGVNMANPSPCPSKDVFVASIINQKTVNQSSQQVLVLIAAQVLKIDEAQFGFATNDDSDTIYT